MPTRTTVAIASINLLAVLACADITAQRGEPTKTRITEERGVIFTAAQTAAVAATTSLLDLEEPFWTPEPEDAEALDQVLRPYLGTSKLPEASAILLDLAEYRFQYFGISRSGRRVLLANALCSEHWQTDSTWRTNAVVVLDGGRCYFRFSMDMHSHQVLDFDINGEA